MTTMSAPALEAPPLLDRDPSRIALEGLSWATFNRILDETGDHRRTRLAFDRGVLELMYPGPLHEGESRGFNRLIEIVAEEIGIPYKAYGSTTWTRNDAEKGVEADECYYFSPEKIAMAGDLSRQRINDSSRYPKPDLAIEIDIRRSAIDRHAIYASLAVPELWSFSGGTLRIEALTPDGSYQETPTSAFVPMPLAEIERWVLERQKYADDGAWARELRVWVRIHFAR